MVKVASLTECRITSIAERANFITPSTLVKRAKLFVFSDVAKVHGPAPRVLGDFSHGPPMPDPDGIRRLPSQQKPSWLGNMLDQIGHDTSPSTTMRRRLRSANKLQTISARCSVNVTGKVGSRAGGASEAFDQARAMGLSDEELAAILAMRRPSRIDRTCPKVRDQVRILNAVRQAP